MKVQKSVKARVVAVGAGVAGVIGIRRVKNKSAVTLAPSPRPRLRRGPLRICPKAVMRRCPLPLMHPTAGSVRGAVAAAAGATAATAGIGKSPARTEKPVAAVSPRPNRWRAMPTKWR